MILKLRIVTAINIVLIGMVAARCDAESMSVAEFRKLNPKQGEFEISGFVAKAYRCPPCPAGVQCKPCMRDNVLVSAKEEILPTYPASGNYLVIFTEAPEKLKLGERYTLRVRVLAMATTSYAVNDLELLDQDQDRD